MLTYKKFAEQHIGGYYLKAAEDIKGFAKKGESLYGDCDNLIVEDWLYQPLNGIYTVFLKNQPDAVTSSNINRSTIVNVYHDDELVFTGAAEEFIRNNDNDEEVAELTDRALTEGIYTYLFVSGEWTVSVA